MKEELLYKFVGILGIAIKRTILGLKKAIEVKQAFLCK